MRSALVLDGRFRVFADGRVNQILDGVETPAKIFKSGEKKKYANVSYIENGRRRTVGVHRLVAMAFIPNPEGKPVVNHKDGDTLRNWVNNLEWATHKENSIHAYESGIINPYRGAKPCIYCGALTKRDGRICSNCDKYNVRWKIGRKDAIQRQLDNGAWRGVSAKDRARKYKEIPSDGLSEQDRKMLEMAQQGMMQKEIAQKLGVSYMTVFYHLKKIATNHFGEIYK